MIDINVNIKGLEGLAEAIAYLAQTVATWKTKAEPVESAAAVQKAAPPVTASVAPTQTPAVAVTPQVTPPVAPPTAPTTSRAYTMDELSAAGAQLMQSLGMPALIGLIQSFGVASLMELPKEQYGEFALKLREMGAQI